MKKVIMWSFITLGLIMLLYQGGAAVTSKSGASENCPYSQAFTGVGAELVESRLDCWATINTSTNHQEMQQMLAQIAKKLNLPADRDDFDLDRHEQIVLVRYNYENGKQKYICTAQSDGRQTHLLISIISTPISSFEREQTAINSVIPVRAARRYTGTLAGQSLTTGDKQDLVKKMFATLQATEVESYHDSTVVSVTGHSRQIKNWLGQGSEKYNLQVAISYNESKGQTYIYLGTPLILGEY